MHVPHSSYAWLTSVRVEMIAVPGATTSGLKRPSLQGPRDENEAIPFALSAIRSLNTGPTLTLQPPLNHPHVGLGWQTSAPNWSVYPYWKSGR